MISVASIQIDKMTADHCNTLVENGCPSQLKWLDFSFLQSCVQRMNDDKSLKVVSFDVAPATKKGENFNSDIFRVSVHYTDSKSSDDKPVSAIFTHTRTRVAVFNH